MSVRTMSLVFEYDMPDLKTDDGKTVPDSTAKFVLLALADHCNDEGEGAYPGVKRICKKTSMSTSTVCNALNALRHNGYTTKLDEKSKSGTNNYTLNMIKFQPLEFQPPKSADSSHRNPPILATEVKPSIKPSINREREATLDFQSMNVSQARKVPTLKMYAEATDFFPGSVVWEYVHTTIQANNLTFEKIHGAAVEWAARGYKPENVKGILEWALHGIPAGKNSPAPSIPKSASDPFESLYSYLDQQEAKP